MIGFGSVLGVEITPALRAACREVVAGAVSEAAALALASLDEVIEEPVTLWTVAVMVLGPACVVCGFPVERGGQDAPGGWAHSVCDTGQLALFDADDP